MAIPDFPEMRRKLLIVLASHPEGLSTRNAYPLMTDSFPDLVTEDLQRETDNGENYWNNRIRWTRNDLLKEGLLDNSRHGIWKLTPEGIELAARLTRLQDGGQTASAVEPQSEASSNEAAQKMLIALLHEMSNAELPWTIDLRDDGSVTLSYDGRLRVILRP